METEFQIMVPAVVIAKPRMDKKARVIVKVRLRHHRCNFYGLLTALGLNLEIAKLKKDEMYAIVPDYDYYHLKAKKLRTGDELYVGLDGDGISNISRRNWFRRKLNLLFD